MYVCGTAANLLSLTMTAFFEVPCTGIHLHPLATLAFLGLLLDATVLGCIVYKACSSNAAAANAGT